MKKATAIAHPIQGLAKYHGMRDPELRLPYHDSISVCTAPSHTKTTAVFEERAEDRYVVDGEELSGRGKERVAGGVDRVRGLGGFDDRVRLESENSFRSNVGFGSSSSGFAAAAMALCGGAGLDLSLPTISTVARRGYSSAARAVTGAFSHLHTGLNDEDCRAERIETDLEAELRIVAGLVPAYKETEQAHEEAADSHMFQARMAHMHGQIAELRDALREGDFDRTFDLAERDSLSHAATTMTGPTGWVYWQPETIEIFDRVRELRSEGVPAYYSTDTGASVYVNTTSDHVERVQQEVAAAGVETHVWEVGGPARLVDDHLF